MAVTITGAYASTKIGPTYTHNVKKLLEMAKDNMPLAQLAQTVTIPLNSGLTARFTRLLRMAKVTSALTEGASGTEVNVAAKHFDVTCADWGNFTQISSLLDDTFINPAVTAYMDVLGINAGESMNLQLQISLAGASITDDIAGITPYIYDASHLTTYNKKGTASAAGSTKSLIDTSGLATEAADFWKYGWIDFTNPAEANYGLSRRVLAFDATSDIVWWTTAVNIATSISTTYRISAPGALAAGTDALAPATFRYALDRLRKQKASPIWGAYYALTMSPESESDCFNVASAGTANIWEAYKYTNNEPILANEIGKYGGFKILRDSNPYTVVITTMQYSDTGTAEICFALGKNALGRAGLSGQTDTKYIIKHPGPQTTSDALDQFHTAGWKTNFARMPINACAAVGLVVAPTGI